MKRLRIAFFVSMPCFTVSFWLVAKYLGEQYLYPLYWPDKARLIGQTIPLEQNLEPSTFSNKDIDSQCDAVISGDTKLIRALRKSGEFPFRDHTTDSQVLQMATNCTRLRQWYRFPPYFVPKATTEELNFPIAYTMLAHKNVNQILVLLSSIYRQHNIHCIHMDAKSSQSTFKALKRAAGCFLNVHLSSERVKVYYAHVSRLEADITCMKDMLQLSSSGIPWRYLINLCSQDFPLKTNLEIVRSLLNLQGQNSIGGHVDLDKATTLRTKFVHRLQYRSKKYKVLAIRRTSRKHGPPPFNLTVAKCSAYNVYTREFLQWALLDGKIGPALLEWSKDTFSPDEHFWLMLNLHQDAPGGSQNPKRSIARRIYWFNKKKPLICRGRWVRGICVFGAGDIHDVLKTKSLFLNKVDVTMDSAGPTCIRRLLDSKSNPSNDTLKMVTSQKT